MLRTHEEYNSKGTKQFKPQCTLTIGGNAS